MPDEDPQEADIRALSESLLFQICHKAFDSAKHSHLGYKMRALGITGGGANT